MSYGGYAPAQSATAICGVCKRLYETTEWLACNAPDDECTKCKHARWKREEMAEKALIRSAKAKIKDAGLTRAEKRALGI
jgi:hypothetical protein